jgi:hypothetical protein
MVTNVVDFPFGNADVQSFAPAASVNLVVRNMYTRFNASAAMAAGMTVNMAIEGQIRVGARVILRAASDGTARTITPGTGCVGTAQAGVISKTFELEFEYNGTAFVLLNARQID